MQNNTIHGFNINVTWQNVSPTLKQHLVSFWLQNRAISNPEEAMRRTDDVVCVVLDAENNIAGVSSVYLAPFGAQNTPYWFYRTFLRKDARKLGLTDRLFIATYQHLSAQPSSAQGLIVITENAGLMSRGAKRRFANVGMQYVGLTQQQQDIWKLDFT